MVNPFDPKTVLFAKHAQHVVLIHFPIALFISAVGFDFAARWMKRQELSGVAYYNLMLAALSTIPVIATGIAAWQLQLEGEKLKGVLLMHLVLAGLSTVSIWITFWMHVRERKSGQSWSKWRLPIEVVGVAAIALTGHLGGFLSGVNGPG